MSRFVINRIDSTKGLLHNMFLWSTAVSGMTAPHPHKNCDMLPADVAVATWVRVMSLSSSLNGSLGMNATGLGYPFADLADERTQSWPLVASPWSACLILALYLLLVHWGPRWMARWVWHTHCQHCSNVSPLSPVSPLVASRCNCVCHCSATICSWPRSMPTSAWSSIQPPVRSTTVPSASLAG